MLIPEGASQRITNTGGSDLVFDCVCTPRFVPEAYRDLDPSPPGPCDSAAGVVASGSPTQPRSPR